MKKSPATNHFPRPGLKMAESIHVQVAFRDQQRIKAEAKSRKMTMSRMMRAAFEEYVASAVPDPDAPTDREVLDNLTSLRDEVVKLGNEIRSARADLRVNVARRSAALDAMALATADLRELRHQIANAVVRVRSR
jgi:hypothetical protein